MSKIETIDKTHLRWAPTRRSFTASLLGSSILLIAGVTSVYAQATLFTYDFPGSPGSGAAASQTNAQPTGATFSDFTRTNVTVNTAGNVFNSSNWSTGAVDATKYVSFNVTPTAGNILFLTSNSTTVQVSAINGGNQGVVTALYGNSGATLIESTAFTPTASASTATFNFTDVISSEALNFRYSYYNMAATTTTGRVDDVATVGSVVTSSSNIALQANTRLYSDVSALTLSGVISGAFSVGKVGANVVTLSGANTYTGGTSVTVGSLIVNNTTGTGTGTGAVTVSNSGTLLGGVGTITGAVTVNSGSRISPGATGGNSIGKFTVGNGGATTGLTLSGTMLTNLSVPTGTSPFAAGTNYDQVSVVGALTLNSTSALSLALTDNYGMTVGDVYYIALNDGTDAISGTFNGITEGASVADNAGDTYTISYAGNGDGGSIGNDISLTVTGIVPVPEPATILGGILLVGAAGWSQRRRFTELLGLAA